MNTVHVVPAREFQPSKDFAPYWQDDLDIWKGIARAYLREFRADSDGARSSVSDETVLLRLKNAREDGKIALHYLGIGLDPLTWKPEMMFVSIFDRVTFQKVFPSIPSGWECLPYDGRVLEMQGQDARTLPAGRGCLLLAHRWRDELGLRDGKTAL